MIFCLNSVRNLHTKRGLLIAKTSFLPLLHGLAIINISLYTHLEIPLMMYHLAKIRMMKKQLQPFIMPSPEIETERKKTKYLESQWCLSECRSSLTRMGFKMDRSGNERETVLNGSEHFAPF